MSNYFILF